MGRQWGSAWVFVVVAAAIGLALYGRAEEQALRSPEPLALAEAPSVPWYQSDWGTSELAGEMQTLPVAEMANEADGVLEVRIISEGRLVPRAQVRLYRREGRMLASGRVQWRAAGGGATGNDGRLWMPALAGTYLVVARAEGLAPAWLTVIHPLGGPRTPVSLRLEEPTVFSGRTVQQGTGQLLPEAELTLIPDMSAFEPEARTSAPPEERVTVTSDSEGRFRVEGLAPGVYTVEGHAPGVAFPVEWTLRLPQAEPQVLALPEPAGRTRTRVVGPPPSQELRCGT